MEGEPGMSQDLCGPWHLQSTVAHTCNWKLRQEFPAMGYTGRTYRPYPGTQRENTKTRHWLSLEPSGLVPELS